MPLRFNMNWSTILSSQIYFSEYFFGTGMDRSNRILDMGYIFIFVCDTTQNWKLSLGKKTTHRGKGKQSDFIFISRQGANVDFFLFCLAFRYQAERSASGVTQKSVRYLCICMSLIQVKKCIVSPKRSTWGKKLHHWAWQRIHRRSVKGWFSYFC